MDEQHQKLLAWIIEASKVNASAANPFGFCYVPAQAEVTLTALATAGLVQVNPTKASDGSIAVRPTQDGIGHKPAHVAKGEPNATRPAPKVEIETGIPLPETKRGGFARKDGGSQIDVYKFEELAIGASFFVPEKENADPEKPIHRTFSSVVSNANRKLFPRNFAIRQAEKDGRQGARVWRLPDLTAPRPKRPRKPKGSVVAQAPAEPVHGFGASLAPFAPPPAPGPSTGFGTGFGGQALVTTIQPFEGGFPPAGPAPVIPMPDTGWGEAPVSSGPLPTFTD